MTVSWYNIRPREHSCTLFHDTICVFTGSKHLTMIVQTFEKWLRSTIQNSGTMKTCLLFKRYSAYNSRCNNILFRWNHPNIVPASTINIQSHMRISSSPAASFKMRSICLNQRHHNEIYKHAHSLYICFGFLPNLWTHGQCLSSVLIPDQELQMEKLVTAFALSLKNNLCTNLLPSPAPWNCDIQTSAAVSKNI